LFTYLTNARFDLEHNGELTGALIDHPEFHPFDEFALRNILVRNGNAVPFSTFIGGLLALFERP
jgi:hypothetical protein